MDKNEINNGLIERIEQLMSFKTMTQRSLSLEIGFSYSTLNKYCNKKSNTIDFELIYRITSHFSDINPKWLVEGIGTMLLSESNNDSKNAERITSLVDTISILRKTINEQMGTNQLLTEELIKAKGELAMIKNERNVG